MGSSKVPLVQEEDGIGKGIEEEDGGDGPGEEGASAWREGK